MSDNARPHEGDAGLDAATEAAAALIASGETDDPAIAAVARGWAARVMSRVSVVADQEDAYAEACIQILELLHAYRPGPEGSTASAYLGTWVPRIASKVAGQQRWHDDQKLRKAAALVESARAELLASGAHATEDEVFAQALLRAGEQAEREILKKNPDLGPEEVAARARARLTKDGLARAFSDIRSGADTGMTPVSLDVSDADGDPVFQLASADQGPESAEALFEGLVGVLLGDQEWALPALGSLFGTDVAGLSDETLTATAKAFGVPVSDLRALGRTAMLRARSPHAHWAHLVGGVATTPRGVSFHNA